MTVEIALRRPHSPRDPPPRSHMYTTYNPTPSPRPHSSRSRPLRSLGVFRVWPGIVSRVSRSHTHPSHSQPITFSWKLRFRETQNCLQWTICNNGFWFRYKRDSNVKKKLITTRDLKPWTKFATQRIKEKRKKENHSFLSRQFCDSLIDGTPDLVPGLVPGLVSGNQGWKCPGSLGQTWSGSKSLKFILIKFLMSILKYPFPG
jgi:hypothetical protein